MNCGLLRNLAQSITGRAGAKKPMTRRGVDANWDWFMAFRLGLGRRPKVEIRGSTIKKPNGQLRQRNVLSFSEEGWEEVEGGRWQVMYFVHNTVDIKQLDSIALKLYSGFDFVGAALF